MLKSGFIAVLGMLLFIYPRQGYAENKTSLGVVDARLESGSVRVNVAARGVTDDKVQFEVKDLAANKALSFSTSPLPIRLWVLVEATQMCKAYKVDAYMASMIGQLKKALPSDSRVSLVAFTGGTVDTITLEKPIGELENLAVRCETNEKSASFERALLRLLDEAPADGMKTSVWVFTAGSIVVGDSTKATLEKRGISVNLILYNVMMENELRRVTDRQNASGSGKIFSLSVLNTSEKILPERWYGMDVTVPGHLKENVLSLSVSASQKGNPVGSETLSLRVDLGKRGFWANWGGVIQLLVLVLILTATLYSIIRYYRAKSCESCGKYLRHGQPTCLFCKSNELGSIVGSFNGLDRHKKDRQDVVFLTRQRCDIGHKRHHQIRLSGKTPGRGLFASIVAETRENGKKAFLLVPQAKGSVFVNGRLSDRPRYLGNGDEIAVAGKRLTFVYGGVENEAQ